MTTIDPLKDDITKQRRAAADSYDEDEAAADRANDFAPWNEGDEFDDITS